MWVNGISYYFNRRVPKDMQGHYEASRIVICLKTTRKDTAARFAKSIAQRLEDYWLSLRLSKIEVPGLHLLRDRPISASVSSCESLLEALELYLRLEGVGRDKVFHSSRRCTYLCELSNRLRRCYLGPFRHFPHLVSWHVYRFQSCCPAYPKDTI